MVHSTPIVADASSASFQELNINLIRTDGNTQIRVTIDNDLIDDYRDCWENGAKFPPITVFYDGATYWLADGFHRLYAAKRAGFTTIPCELRTGEKRDAILAACEANADHGLREEAFDSVVGWVKHNRPHMVYPKTAGSDAVWKAYLLFDSKVSRGSSRIGPTARRALDAFRGELAKFMERLNEGGQQ